MWNWETGELIKSLEAHSATVTCLDTMNHILVSGSEDKTIKVWNWQTGQLLHTLEGHSTKVKSVQLQGKYIILSQSEDDIIKIWVLRNRLEE